jgi:hypothetical protein
MTQEEKQLLEGIDKKLDTIIDFWNMKGEKRPTARELQEWAKDAMGKHRRRKELKSSPGMGRVLPITRKGDRKDERETGKG